MSRPVPVVFSPENEPYLGRSLLFHFDQIISTLMETNAATAALTHSDPLSDAQQMAAQVIPQSVSITLAIRELIRQGYLFGAHVLRRPLVERVAILLYLHHYPERIDVWTQGWEGGKAPTLAKMFEAISEKHDGRVAIRGKELTASMNSLLHGKPDSAPWNLVAFGSGQVGHAASKILDRPDLCDELCADVMPWIAVLLGMMAAYFPNEAAA